MAPQHTMLCLSLLSGLSRAWLNPITPRTSLLIQNRNHCSGTSLQVSKHGENSCFLPLRQLDQDYYPPRIIQIAGAYPGLCREEFESVTSEESPDPGQWTYDFSDSDGPQVGTIAVEGSSEVHYMEDPVALIGDHFNLGVPLPDVLTEPVDLVMLVDRSIKHFSERKFLVLDVPGQEELEVGAFNTKAEMPEGSTVLGQVELVQIPWLPCMKPTKSGFMEVDEYF